MAQCGYGGYRGGYNGGFYGGGSGISIGYSSYAPRSNFSIGYSSVPSFRTAYIAPRGRGHFDYHPTTVIPHRNHYHVQPGHFDYHRGGHRFHR